MVVDDLAEQMARSQPSPTETNIIIYLPPKRIKMSNQDVGRACISACKTCKL
jgi:hypothetical protein